MKTMSVYREKTRRKLMRFLEEGKIYVKNDKFLYVENN